MNKWILIIGALLGATAVMTGAFGAHALQSVLDERARGWYDTAVTYHAGHALAILITGIVGLHIDTASGVRNTAPTEASLLSDSTNTTTAESSPTNVSAGKSTPGKFAVRFAGISLLIGVLIFSGSLYVMALTGITKLGMITPIGGVFLILGWLSLAVAASRIKTGVS